MKKILVVSSGLVHPNLLCRLGLRNVLSELKNGATDFVTNIEDLVSLQSGEYRAVVLYFQRSKISDKALEAMENFVFNGGGLLAIHSASASFKKNTRYYNLLGGKFISHGPVSEFKVAPIKGSRRPFGGISSFMVVDELYIHRYKGDVTMHFQTEINGKKEPVVWTRELGRGRLAYCSLGHRPSIFKIPEVRQIIKNSMKWLVQ